MLTGNPQWKQNGSLGMGLPQIGHWEITSQMVAGRAVVLEHPNNWINMSALTNEKCAACRRDSPLVTEADVQELKSHVPDWTLVDRDGIQRLERVFTFKNFVEALSFTNRIGALAEAEGHHPAILTAWGRVTVTLWTQDSRAPSQRLHHGRED
jgi:4a-hydroxytetrahydrobiopterin dehydratase